MKKTRNLTKQPHLRLLANRVNPFGRWYSAMLLSLIENVNARVWLIGLTCSNSTAPSGVRKLGKRACWFSNAEVGCEFRISMSWKISACILLQFVRFSKYGTWMVWCERGGPIEQFRWGTNVVKLWMLLRRVVSWWLFSSLLALPVLPGVVQKKNSKHSALWGCEWSPRVIAEASDGAFKG